jgi:hypothetical protein
MSLTARKPRPLSRDTGRFRDDRLFIVACDDTFAPKQYFDFFRIPRIQIHVVETPDGSSAAGHVLDRLLAVEHDEDDERWLLLDVDHYGAGHHLQSLTTAIAEARRQGVNIAFSKPCFELWLLLHHADESTVTNLANADDVERSLRSVLGQYNKTRLRSEDFPMESVSEACVRAERLDNTVGGGDIPNANTARVYRIWKSVVAKALPSQLPDAIRRLLP